MLVLIVSYTIFWLVYNSTDTLEKILSSRKSVCHSKLSLQLDMEIAGSLKHQCDLYVIKARLEDDELEVIDNLINLETKVQEETLFTIIYIASYVQCKNGNENQQDIFIMKNLDAS
jgi:hypothetical protein